jgi:hypothetical protein
MLCDHDDSWIPCAIPGLRLQDHYATEEHCSAFAQHPARCNSHKQILGSCEVGSTAMPKCAYLLRALVLRSHLHLPDDLLLNYRSHRRKPTAGEFKPIPCYLKVHIDLYGCRPTAGPLFAQTRILPSKANGTRGCFKPRQQLQSHRLFRTLYGAGS